MLLAGTSEPIRRIYFETDGVLDESWLSRTLAIRPGTRLMGVEIFDLKADLEKHGQVRSATVERRFPDGIVVRLKEETPRCRIAFRGAYGEVEAVLVAESGKVYRGANYGPEALDKLPYLTGIALQRTTNGAFLPIDGMDQVCALLDAAERTIPRIRGRWRVVEVAETPGQDLFRVSARGMPDTVFRVGAFEEQLSKLDYILRDLTAQVGPERRELVNEIDISLDGPAIVSFREPATGTTRPSL